MNSLAARVLSYVGEPTVLSFLFCGAYLRHLEPVACLSDQVVVDDTDGLGLGGHPWALRNAKEAPLPSARQGPGRCGLTLPSRGLDQAGRVEDRRHDQDSIRP